MIRSNETFYFLSSVLEMVDDLASISKTIVSRTKITTHRNTEYINWNGNGGKTIEDKPDGNSTKAKKNVESNKPDIIPSPRSHTVYMINNLL